MLCGFLFEVFSACIIYQTDSWFTFLMLRLTFLFLLAKKQNNWKYVIQLNWGKTILVFFHLINLKEFREISLSNLTTELFLHYFCKISKFPCFYNSHQTYWDFANFAGGGGSVCSSPGLVNGPMSNQNSPGLCNGPMSNQNSPGLCNGSMSSHNSPLSNQNSPGNYQPYTRPILRVHTFFFIKVLVKTPTLRGHATKNIPKLILLVFVWTFEGVGCLKGRFDVCPTSILNCSSVSQSLRKEQIYSEISSYMPCSPLLFQPGL